MEQKGIMEIETLDDVLVIRFAAASIGSGHDLEQMSQDIRDLISQKKPSRMIFDFTRVSFFSSHMLGLLVDVWRRVKDCGGVVAISGINPNLTRVFRITNLDKVFVFYPNTETALKAMVRSKGK